MGRACDGGADGQRRALRDDRNPAGESAAGAEKALRGRRAEA
jgi:hypothetical protein